MRLNEYSHCHKRIRLLCFQLAQLTGMSLATDLSKDFQEIKFQNELSYIVIDFKNEVIFSMSYHLANIELDTAQDILLYCSWLYTGEQIENRMRG